MRLALIHHQFTPTAGGLEKYLHEFATRLHAAGHELEFITSKCAPEAAQLATRIHTIWRPPLARWHLGRFARRAAQIAGSLKVDATLGFGHTWRQDIHRAGGGCHAEFSLSLTRAKRESAKNRLALALERKLYTSGETREFVVNSHRVARELTEHYQVNSQHIHIIRTAVDHEKFRPARNADERRQIRSDLQIPADERALLFVSASEFRRKGLATGLAALAQLPEARLWIAGPALDREHRLLAAKLGVGERVRELGNRPDMPAIFRAADVFVHPTRYDACANSALQSLASGLPGIISSQDGASEFIDHGLNGFVLQNPQSADELASLARRALDLSPEERAQLSQRAAASTISLTWDAHLLHWEKLLGAIR